ncbi:MAG: YHS domain-containing (seleno)protein [Planctomycetota bacterium]
MSRTNTHRTSQHSAGRVGRAGAATLCVLGAATLLGAPAGAASAQADQPAAEAQQAERYRNIGEWDLGRRDLAIGGYDPVAYFPEGGGKATKGKKNIETRYKGVVYRFKSTANRDLFLRAPDRYEPQYGGWCAWAMAQGGKTEVNPKSFIVRDDKLFLFYDGLFGDTRKDWREGNHASLVTQADGTWNGFSGESPYSAPAPGSEG